MKILGIDPGLKGGLAYLEDDLLYTTVMPVVGSEINLSGLTREINEFAPDLVVVEKVHAMPKQGVSSTFKFGVGYGAVLGICAAMDFSVVLVTPQAWKRTVLAGLDWKGDKDMSAVFCSRRFPEYDFRATDRCRKPHDGMTDAACIALYGRDYLTSTPAPCG